MAAESAEDFVPAALASLGIETDEIEAAVVAATHQLFWPEVLALLELDLAGLEHERDPDFSRAP